MMEAVCRYVVAVMLAAAGSGAFAQDAPDMSTREELALEIIELTDADSMTEAIGAQMRAGMMRQVEGRIQCDAMRPAVDEAVAEITGAFAELMNSMDLRAQMVIAYADAFSEQELRDIAAFYRSEAGRKMVEKTPEIMGRMMEASQEHVASLQARLQESMARHAETFAAAERQCAASAEQERSE